MAHQNANIEKKEGPIHKVQWVASSADDNKILTMMTFSKNFKSYDENLVKNESYSESILTLKRGPMLINHEE